jgi:hypothetical protein
LASMVIFFTTSLLGSYITRELCIMNQTLKNCNVYQITVIRVLVTNSLFILNGLVLSYFLFNLAKLPTVSILMEQQVSKLQNKFVQCSCVRRGFQNLFRLTKGSSICQAVTATIGTSILFISRTIYNLLAITFVGMHLPDFGFDWINVSDQADLTTLTDTKKYATFIVVLLIWEIIPTSIVLILFRMKRTQTINYQTIMPSLITRIIGKSQFLSPHNPSTNNNDDDDDTDLPNERTSLLQRRDSSSISVIEDSDQSSNSSSSIITYHSVNENNATPTAQPIIHAVNRNYGFLSEI